jgi:hypothetical protein
MCDTFKSLPGPGGVLEQDSYAMWLLSLYLEAKAERRQKDLDEQERSAKSKTPRR